MTYGKELVKFYQQLTGKKHLRSDVYDDHKAYAFCGHVEARYTGVEVVGLWEFRVAKELGEKMCAVCVERWLLSEFGNGDML